MHGGTFIIYKRLFLFFLNDLRVFFDSLEKWYYQRHWIRNFRFWKVLNHTRYEIMHGNSISPLSLQLTLPIPFPLPLSLSHHPSPLWGFPWLSIWREFENQPTASNSSNYFLTSNTRHWNCERIMASKELSCLLFVCFFALGVATYCNYDSDCFIGKNCL